MGSQRLPWLHEFVIQNFVRKLLERQWMWIAKILVSSCFVSVRLFPVIWQVVYSNWQKTDYLSLEYAVVWNMASVLLTTASKTASFSESGLPVYLYFPLQPKDPHNIVLLLFRNCFMMNVCIWTYMFSVLH